MKRLAQMTLALGIAFMCVYPSKVSGQNRVAHSENSTRENSQRSRSASSSSRSNTRSSVKEISSQQQQKTASQQQKAISQQQRSVSQQQRSASQQQRSVSQQQRSASQQQRSVPQQQRSASQQQRSVSQQQKAASQQQRSVLQQSRPSSITHTSKPKYQGVQKPQQEVSRPNRDPNPSKGQSHHNWQRPMLKPDHKPAPAYHYGPHNFGYRLELMPPNTVRYDFGRRGYYKPIPYYVHDGVFYRPFPSGGYVVCRPPVGVRIASSLFNTALQVAVINSYYDALYRAQRAALVSAQYATVNASYTPRTYNEISVSMSDTNTSYYFQDGVFYIYDRGEYQVIEPPVGALVKELPDDYEELILKGETFYLVEDTLYKVSVIDGTAYFEVVCNL